MAREDTIIMSMKELRRGHLIHRILERGLTQAHAAEVMGLTDRQVRRLIKRVRAEGDGGLVHRGRGRPSNRRWPERLKTRILRLYEQRYGDFGPTLAAEKLAERDGLTLSEATLRRWLLARGITHFRRRARPHRQWRERKQHGGEMLQLDGSHHDWLEGRGPKCVVMAYIDDATSRVWARFYAYEGTIPAMDSVGHYVRRYGIPLAVYADRHTTYTSPAEPTIEEQLEGREPQSQFGRALRELGVELIPAYSPQAKGRVERLFKTFQDRLVKELRLAGIRTMEEANRFLEGYLPLYNRRFSVQPAQAADLHRPIPRGLDLDRILCLKTERTVRNDCTVAYHGRLYQIHDHVRARKVLVEEGLDGTLRLTYQGRPLHYQALASRPVRVPEAPRLARVPRPTTPGPDHPWRQFLYGRRGRALHAAPR